MRVTQSKIKENMLKKIDGLVQEQLKVPDDITLTKDFTRDVYSLFDKKGQYKGREFKGFWKLFCDVKKVYINTKLRSIFNLFSFYNNISNFLHTFIRTKLFKQLDKLPAFDATRTFVELFKQDPPPQRQQSQNNSQQKQDNQQQQSNQQQRQDNQQQKHSKKKQSGRGQKEQKKQKRQKDQQGRSAKVKNLPIDPDKIKQKTEKIEQLIDSGMFDDESIKDMTDRYIQKRAGSDSCPIDISNINKLIEKIADSLNRELAIFKVARKYEQLETYKKTEEITKSLVPDNEMTIGTNQSVEDVLKALPSEYLYDDDVFYLKVFKHELLVREYETRRLKKQALYLLVDISGSMTGPKNIYASGVALSLVKQAFREKATYFLRFFDQDTSRLFKVTNYKEAQGVCDVLTRQPYSGGGTDIDNALRIAIKDITASPEKFEKAEIMLISDGEDCSCLEKSDLKDIKLHTTMIGTSGVYNDIKKISTTFTNITSEDISKYDEDVDDYIGNLPF